MFNEMLETLTIFIFYALFAFSMLVALMGVINLFVIGIN